MKELKGVGSEGGKDRKGLGENHCSWELVHVMEGISLKLYCQEGISFSFAGGGTNSDYLCVFYHHFHSELGVSGPKYKAFLHPGL